MKKLLTFLILLAPLYAQAVNYLGFGGGNYVYAEQGNLYFNLDQNTFDHRKWSYDGEKFTSNISIKLDLKTKYTSDDWYEEVLANKKSDGLMYANYIKQPFSYQNRGGYQKVILPAAGWALGGFVARQFAWNRFKSWALGSAFLYGSAKFFCSELMNDGITCDSAGAFTKVYNYAYVSNIDAPAFSTPIRVTEAEYVDRTKLLSIVQNKAAKNFKLGSNSFELTSCRLGDGTATCAYLSDGSYSAYSIAFTKEAKTIEEMVSDPELMPYFDKTCKLFPSECVNEPTNGKNINDVQLTAGSISGGVSVTGPPYTNPISGEAQQDKVVIGGASSGIGINSGTNSSWQYTPSMGQSTTDNKVDVSTTARPDLTNTGTADVAKPNNQTGTKPDVIVPPVTVPEFTDLNDMIDFCKANPNALSCVEVEQVDESKIEIPQVTENLNLQVKNYITSSAGVCPQGSTFSVSMFGATQTAEFSFTPACQFADYLKYAVWAAAWLLAAQIVMGRNQS